MRTCYTTDEDAPHVKFSLIPGGMEKRGSVNTAPLLSFVGGASVVDYWTSNSLTMPRVK